MNCKATLSLRHAIVDTSNEDEVIAGLMILLSENLDLTENEDEFQEDTLELGYNSEADRIIKEYIAEHGVPKDVYSFIEAFEEISKHISDDDYYAGCETSFLTIDETRVAVAFASGGNE